MSLSIGVIGAGIMGADHAQNIHRFIAGADVVAIADPDKGRADAAIAGIPGARVLSDPDQLITADDVQAVVIASPDFLHADQVKACLEAGKHVLVEKPLAYSIGEGRAMAEAARGLIALGFEIVATRGTAVWLAEQGVKATAVNKVYEGRPNIVDALKNNEIALVMNTTEGAQALADSRDIRRVALMDKIPYFTTAAASIAAVAAMKARSEGYGVRTLQG